jgi:hypothetical protein
MMLLVRGSRGGAARPRAPVGVLLFLRSSSFLFSYILSHVARGDTLACFSLSEVWKGWMLRSGQAEDINRM